MLSKTYRHILLTFLLLASVARVDAQRFYNLTADEVRIDSVLPQFGCSIPLARPSLPTRCPRCHSPRPLSWWSARKGRSR